MSDNPHPFTPRPSGATVGRAERYRIDVPSPVVIVAVEAFETVRVYGLKERPNDSVRVAADERLVWLAPEASTETLEAMRDAINAELGRRAAPPEPEPDPAFIVQRTVSQSAAPVKLQCPACFGENSRGCPECQGAGSIPG